MGATEWQATDGLLAAFAERRAMAIQRFTRIVAEGIGVDSTWNNLEGPAFLGDGAFVARRVRHAKQEDDVNIPKAQRRPPPPRLERIAHKHRNRNAVIVAARAAGGYCDQRTAAGFGLHFTTVWGHRPGGEGGRSLM